MLLLCRRPARRTLLHMTSSTIASIDLLLRSAAIGQILLIGAVYIRFPLRHRDLALLGVAVCLSAQLLLTTVSNVATGYWRNGLLVLTDASAYAIWFAALSTLNDRFAAIRWTPSLKVAIAVLALWHIYFFGVRGGAGPYHQVNHVVAIVLLSHVVFVALQGWNDDLVDTRRRMRLLVVGVIGMYGIVLALTQIVGDGFRGNEIFRLANAGLCFVGALLFGRHLLLRPVPQDPMPTTGVAAQPAAPEVPPELRALNQRLDAFIDRRGYTQSNLTIAGLAAELGAPEHRLRRLINSGLGYRNFSDFLNRHRVADACRQLADPALNAPVLTLALDLGYGSIGPFNRAFKAQMDMTPTEFRDSARNRP